VGFCVLELSWQEIIPFQKYILYLAPLCEEKNAAKNIYTRSLQNHINPFSGILCFGAFVAEIFP